MIKQTIGGKMRWCKEKTLYNGLLKESSFLASKENFYSHIKRGTPFLNAAVKYLGAKNCTYSREIVYQNKIFLNKYENSKILLVGAGPSFKNAKINYKHYDYIWSCNHFYKNEVLKSIDVDFITLGNENNLLDEELLEYLDNNKTIICFENKYTKTHELKEINEKYSDRVFWCFTRYHSRIGSIPRLAAIAASFKVKKIDFIGMDGYAPKNLTRKYGSSTFEPEKKISGTIEDTSSEQQALALYKEQYLTFWDYMLHDIGKEISFTNLGHGHPCNLSTLVLEEKLGENYRNYLLNPEERL